MSDKTLLKTDVRVWRETNAEGVNLILNNPEVRPWVADMTDGVIDISASVSNPDNILLMGKHGAIFFICVMPGTYECHTQILPEGRGGWAHKFAIAVLDWMFARSNAWEVVTRIPSGHLGALTLAKGVGFRYEFTSMEPCHFRGEVVKASTYRQTLQEWIGLSDHFAQAGAHVHLQMLNEAKRLGMNAVPHEEDQYHNQVAGAAVEMARHGFAVKGTLFYDRWAVLARHRSISLVSKDPPIIRMDIGDMHILADGIRIV